MYHDNHSSMYHDDQIKALINESKICNVISLRIVVRRLQQEKAKYATSYQWELLSSGGLDKKSKRCNGISARTVVWGFAKDSKFRNGYLSELLFQEALAKQSKICNEYQWELLNSRGFDKREQNMQPHINENCCLRLGQMRANNAKTHRWELLSEALIKREQNMQSPINENSYFQEALTKQSNIRKVITMRTVVWGFEKWEHNMQPHINENCCLRLFDKREQIMLCNINENCCLKLLTKESTLCNGTSMRTVVWGFDKREQNIQTPVNENRRLRLWQ